MKSLLLIGCGGHARSLIELIESTGCWNIHGLVGLHQVGSRVLVIQLLVLTQTCWPCGENVLQRYWL